MTSAAWQAGELSEGQVEAMVAVIKPEMVALFAQHQAELVPSLVGLSVADTSRAMGHWAAHAAALGDGPSPQSPSGACTCPRCWTAPGCWMGPWTLSPVR